MSSQAVFSFLGGGGVVSVVLALLGWARGKGKDQADVAKAWESGVSTLLTSTREQVKNLDADLKKMRVTATETQHKLDDTLRDARVLKALLDDTLDDLEQRGADTTSYRERAAKLRVV